MFPRDAKYVVVSRESKTRLWCNVCGSDFGTRSNVWKKHVTSDSHCANVAAEEEKPKPKPKPLAAFFLENEKAQAEVTIANRHRQRVLEAFLEQGIPLSKCSGKLKELLEEKRDERVSVGHVSHLAQNHLPAFVSELDRLDLMAVKNGDGRCSFMFDGYSSNGDYAIVIMRVVLSDFSIVERCVALRIYRDHLDHIDWTNLVVDTVRRLNVKLVFSIADGHPSNGLVGETLSSLTRNYFHAFCLSHSLVKVGARFCAPLLDQFMQAWNKVFKNSSAARQEFQSITGEKWKRKHRVRWWTQHVQHQQLVNVWPQLWKIVQRLKQRSLCEDSLPQLEKLVAANLVNQEDKSEGSVLCLTSELAMQLATIFDGAQLFVRATYFFERSGFVSPFVYQFIDTLNDFVKRIQGALDVCKDLPTVCALIRRNGAANERICWGNAKRALHPGFQYFTEHFVRFSKESKARKFEQTLQLYKFCRLLHPVYLLMAVDGRNYKLEEDLTDIVVQILLNLGPHIVTELNRDFRDYVETCRNNNNDGQKVRVEALELWWREHGSECKSWAAAARLFCLLQPSEASAERGFAMLRQSETSSQLEDLQSSRVRMRYHRRDDVDDE